MLQYIETTGKNEEEAINAALRKLGLDRDEVSVEVLERAKTGFLGIGACPAKVKVTYEAPDEEPAEEEKPAQPAPAAPVAKETPKAVHEAPAAPAAPVLTLLQWIVNVVLTGEVMGTRSSPCCWPAPPSVALAAMAMEMGISLPAAAPLVTVMPSGAPAIVPTVGVTFEVP